MPKCACVEFSRWTPSSELCPAPASPSPQQPPDGSPNLPPGLQKQQTCQRRPPHLMGVHRTDGTAPYQSGLYSLAEASGQTLCPFLVHTGTADIQGTQPLKPGMSVIDGASSTGPQPIQPSLSASLLSPAPHPNKTKIMCSAKSST